MFLIKRICLKSFDFLIARKKDTFRAHSIVLSFVKNVGEIDPKYADDR